MVSGDGTIIKPYCDQFVWCWSCILASKDVVLLDNEVESWTKKHELDIFIEEIKQACIYF